MRYLHLLDDIKHRAEITPDIAEQLQAYPQVVRSVIDRINTVLIDHHS